MIDFKCIHGDCVEEMKKMPDGCVDVIFTSPPYNDSGKSERDKETKRHFKYEEIENREDWYEWQVECIDEMLRLAKRQVLYNIQAILSNKADVSVNIYAFLKAQKLGKEVELSCAIGDTEIDGKPYAEIVEIARKFIKEMGGFEKFAEWGLF